ncbi:hypothetical protein O181_047528 [Austropuccinia psidii MF-1]|uniref:ABC1 atypical kinase-like domain-containing protein n=1 Tax=Austropuccinia psidii MF-1 TaxID=1389203 RepID=A0A9Q3DU63_9BASI|nr:hypothetical protein [Austropuccinia psidii MF-1]
MKTPLKIIIDIVTISKNLTKLFKLSIKSQLDPIHQAKFSNLNKKSRFIKSSFNHQNKKFSSWAIQFDSNPSKLNRLNHINHPSTSQNLNLDSNDNNINLTNSTDSSNQKNSINPPLRPSRVPSSQLARLLHYGGLAAGIGWGTVSEALRRTTIDTKSTHPIFLSEPNVKRLVDKLTKMRGAALKLGQFMSIQDAKILPPQIEQIFAQVQTTADYMPFSQAEDVLKNSFGTNWSQLFTDFVKIPLAAASIGQVHVATTYHNHKDPIKLAVKIQFPGVYQSILSDLSYLNILTRTTGILPPGLFLSRTLQVLGQELKDECDYKREASCANKMWEFLKSDSRFRVPKVFDHLSSQMVLTTEFMSGVSLKNAQSWSSSLRNKIGYDILELCFREILHFRLMQTDPNWSNFLWNESNQQIELIDFGATREYSQQFVEDYVRLLISGVNDNRTECIEASIKLGYLTGQESEEMLDSQFRTIRALSEPFRTTQQPYDFSQQTITDRVRAEIPTMVRLRLTPPPVETYSLNRKLSGMFLLCSRLGCQIDCKKLLEDLLRERKSGSWTSQTV